MYGEMNRKLLFKKLQYTCGHLTVYDGGLHKTLMVGKWMRLGGDKNWTMVLQNTAFNEHCTTKAQGDMYSNISPSS